jgi:hypothetical protein
MSSEISYFVSYACPGCRRQLEARSTIWTGWVRCPICKCPALPPEITWNLHEGGRWASDDSVDEGTLIAPGSAAGALDTDSSVIDRPARSSHTTPARLIFTTGLALSIFLVLVAFLDEKMGRMAIFGFLAFGFLWLLVRTPRNQATS